MTALFPTLPTGFSAHRKPIFSTKIVKHVSGRTVRRSLYATPLFGFELTCEALSSGPALQSIPAFSKQALEGFFTDRKGSYEPFLYQDSADNAVTGQILGIGDGVTTSFTCLWPLGSTGIPVGQVETSGLAIYLNGVAQAGSVYTVILPNTLVFNTAPAAGAAITGDYSFYFLCCFDDDVLDFEEFMDLLWSVGSIKFTSVKA